MNDHRLREAIKDTQLEVRNASRYSRLSRVKLEEHLYKLLDEEARRAMSRQEKAPN